MTKQEFEKIIWNRENNPIFKITGQKGVFIAVQSEFAGVPGDLCAECDEQLEKHGSYDYDCGCQMADVPYIGLWTPQEWRAETECYHFVRDENTTKEMIDYNWTCVEIENLVFTGKYKK